MSADGGPGEENPGGKAAVPRLRPSSRPAFPPQAAMRAANRSTASPKRVRHGARTSDQRCSR